LRNLSDPRRIFDYGHFPADGRGPTFRNPNSQIRNSCHRFIHPMLTTLLGLADLPIGLESERIDAAPAITFDGAAAKWPLFAKL
jgi:hypothetical protein